uniref:Uncharacterized protein n=1 Tax=Myotis myotis TaxID=51298 RepID=A0A7J8ALJ6_MYOMY|nr:hypothetical protein mMyoMyo1_007943 [Myotis myotis]
MAEEDKPYADAVQVFRDLACASNSIKTKWPRVPVTHIVQQLTEHAVVLVANTNGICYIQTNGPKTEVIYTPQESFEIRQAKVISQSVNNKSLYGPEAANCRLELSRGLPGATLSSKVLGPSKEVKAELG